MGAEFPTSDEIATAVVAACRETGGDPVLFYTEQNRRIGLHRRENGRARMYAMLALKNIFNDVSGSDLAAMLAVGLGQRENYLSTVRWQLKNKALKWWNDQAFVRVKQAVRALHGAVVEIAPKPEPPALQPLSRAQVAGAFDQRRRVLDSKPPNKLPTQPVKPTTRAERIRQQARQIEAALGLNDQARFARLAQPRDRDVQPYIPDKSRERAILAEAAANTAAQQRRNGGGG